MKEIWMIFALFTGTPDFVSNKNMGFTSEGQCSFQATMLWTMWPNQIEKVECRKMPESEWIERRR